MTSESIELIAPEPGGRLDQILAAEVPALSRTRWQDLIKSGVVLVDGRQVTRPSHALSGGEALLAEIPPAEPTDLIPEFIPLEILFEDDHLLVVNKPAGVVVHPGAGNRTGTLVQAVLAHAPDIAGVGGKKRPGVVHRLDKGTTGVLLFAKDDRTHIELQRAFQERDIEKRYLALVDGAPPSGSGRIEGDIGRDPVHRTRMSIQGRGGRHATTIFRTLWPFDRHTLLQLEPITGRTHQIRVHLAFVGCPVVGDSVYGKPHSSIDVPHLMLHAWKLRLPDALDFATPEFEAPIPKAFLDTLSVLSPPMDAAVLGEMTTNDMD